MKECVVCGIFHNKTGVTCSQSCGTIKREQTMLKRYGAKNPSQSKQFQEKRLQTFRNKFGCDNPFQNFEVKKKIEETNIKNRGFKNPTYRFMTNYENYNKEFIVENFTTDGVATLFDRTRLMQYFNLSCFTNACQTYKLFGIPYEKLKNNTSSSEIKLFLELEQRFNKLIFENNNRKIIINPDTGNFLEIDIIVKRGDKIICGIEYNGTYWHDKENPVKEELKSKLCEEKGFKLFHIWEDSVEKDMIPLLNFLKGVEDEII